MEKAPGIAVAVLIEAEIWEKEPALEEGVREAIAAAAVEADTHFLPQAEVSVLLTDDAAVRELNRVYRGIDKATNVLSFPQQEGEENVYGPLLGDIAVAYETVRQEAEEGGLLLRHHLTHMLVHGFLHLIGYTHEEEKEAERMEETERRILARLGIPDPYARADRQ